MEKAYTMQEIKDTLTPIFKANPIDKAILFGSYAKGTARPNSDIDILIDSGGKLDGIDFYGVWGDVADALNIDVDLLDRGELIDGGRVQQEINTTGVVIYEKP